MKKDFTYAHPSSVITMRNIINKLFNLESLIYLQEIKHWILQEYFNNTAFGKQFQGSLLKAIYDRDFMPQPIIPSLSSLQS